MEASGQLHACGPFTLGTLWIGDWVGPSTCLDVSEKRKIYRRESNPACNLVTILIEIFWLPNQGILSEYTLSHNHQTQRRGNFKSHFTGSVSANDFFLLLPVWSIGLISQFLDHFTDSMTPWTGDQLVARLLPKHRTT
jgi:hypothetical protein